MNILPHEHPLSYWRTISKQNGIHPDTFRYRIRQGWAPNKAATTPPHGKEHRHSLRYKARKAGVHQSTAWSRVNKQGMTIEEALAR